MTRWTQQTEPELELGLILHSRPRSFLSLHPSIYIRPFIITKLTYYWFLGINKGFYKIHDRFKRWIWVSDACIFNHSFAKISGMIEIKNNFSGYLPNTSFRGVGKDQGFETCGRFRTCDTRSLSSLGRNFYENSEIFMFGQSLCVGPQISSKI